MKYITVILTKLVILAHLVILVNLANLVIHSDKPSECGIILHGPDSEQLH